MRVGTSLEFGAPNYTPYSHAERFRFRETIARVARELDEAGLDSLWVPDHLFQIPIAGAVELPMLEAYTVLAFVAGITERIRLGTLVTAAVYRAPGLLGKIISSLDVLSGGRTYMGIGAAWNAAEADGLGIPFPGTAERFERLEETIQVLLRMWAGDERPFEGRHYRLARPLNSPNALQQPHPPLLIGGGGERKTLRLVAQYADACNLIVRDHATLRHKLEVLADHCDRSGRPYDEIEKTAWLQVDLDTSSHEHFRSPSEALDELAALAGMGIDHAIVYVPDLHSPGRIDLLAELQQLAAPLVAHGRQAPL